MPRAGLPPEILDLPHSQKMHFYPIFRHKNAILPLVLAYFCPRGSQGGMNMLTDSMVFLPFPNEWINKWSWWLKSIPWLWRVCYKVLICYTTKFATQKVYPTTKVCSNMSAGSVISYTSERGLIKKLDGVALLITDHPTICFTALSNKKSKNKKGACDTWQVGEGEPSLKISAPWLLRFGSEGVLEIGRKRVTHLISHSVNE